MEAGDAGLAGTTPVDCVWIAPADSGRGLPVSGRLAATAAGDNSLLSAHWYSRFPLPGSQPRGQH